MFKIARRFTIITLAMAVFAVSLSAFVEAQRREPRLQAGQIALCDPLSGNACSGTL
ncbi:hypothetical protein [Rhizobium sp. SSA_523]|uniref:hypothetical protein n=1 Tax=Rhizobium sp. SSA_523 TaxID=2952477 RepID=UPI00209163AC|nr:hypothetical protein [Rhizobium sp. SSA_523]MCO5730860.1 hypothetical protein [Rhizobium sp. SSA_523]WKC24321.1 hypothetical protein QTJ18_09645 [Rhizobium sp. SSA_523]